MMNKDVLDNQCKSKLSLILAVAFAAPDDLWLVSPLLFC